jgi:hypothetical protein
MLRNGNEFRKLKVMRISRQPSTVGNMIDEKNWTMWNISTVWVA